MKIIVGLGNPGEKYKNTRHNVGFFAVDSFAKMLDSNSEFRFNKKFNAEIFESVSKGEKVIIIQPHTFMNLSGECASNTLQFYKADISDLIVIHDDIDLLLGEARTKLEGGSAGHKGIQNIIDVLGSDRFARIRIGIMPIDGGTQIMSNQDSQIETKDFVLSQFTDREEKIIENVVAISNDYLLRSIVLNEPLKATTLRTQTSAS
jgi:PTH1 family peptidyl-tRNA hydrolase